MVAEKSYVPITNPILTGAAVRHEKCGAYWLVLVVYLYQTSFRALIWIGGFYLAVMVCELLFSKRGMIFRSA